MRQGAVLDRRYRIDEKLAAGGFGVIYRATDLVMGREVALKVLHRELASDATVVERFRREAAALAMLRDPHTVTMYDAGHAADGTRYIVLELLRGESLHARFHAHGKRLPWRRVAQIARGVCSSLREAHAAGIVHRDLKPANIHLEQHALQRDYVKVLDFGIAKMVDASEPSRDLTLAGQMVGTFDYMPPEQMIGGTCTGRSDVFTLAVVMYEMICGERPFGDAKGPASMLMAVLGSTPTPLRQRADVPLSLDRLVMRALERDPDDRVDVVDFDDELARILDDLFDDEEARFGDEDGPTWLDPQPMRRTPTNLPSTLRPPAKVASADTMLGTVPATPARGVPVLPPVLPVVRIKPASPPTEPSAFAVGSRTQIAPLTNVPIPNGTTPVDNERLLAHAESALPNTTLTVARARAHERPHTDESPPARSHRTLIRGMAYAVLLAMVAIAAYQFYRLAELY